ncbi:hypothetical protein LSH36_532g06001 [Paralvinella palmiformis]|uniref:Uncharacterized protein n=1 Tax=Paralvinella palmiformis TaxID=53620 RepID=A0AAD9J815_9ANNE|nr:hypothetical protein LSH36_532g06001 [Paralvinella palmiformis]
MVTFALQKRKYQPLPPSATIRLSSISSQDSGFTSQDALYLRPPSPSLLDFRRKNSCHETGSSGSSTGTDSGGTTPSPSYPVPPSSAISTWANWPDPPYVLKQELHGDRPHTISTAYERSHSRPPLSTDMFEPPEGHKVGRGHQTAPPTPNPYAVPCISLQGRTDGRAPNVPPPPLLGPKPRSKAVPTPTVPELARKTDGQRKTTGDCLLVVVVVVVFIVVACFARWVSV